MARLAAIPVAQSDAFYLEQHYLSDPVDVSRVDPAEE